MRVEIVMNILLPCFLFFYIVYFHAPDISRGQNSVLN